MRTEKEQSPDDVCECGHNHISYVGDIDKEEAGYERIEECENCDCEKFKPKRAGEIKG